MGAALLIARSRLRANLAATVLLVRARGPRRGHRDGLASRGCAGRRPRGQRLPGRQPRRLTPPRRFVDRGRRVPSPGGGRPRGRGGGGTRAPRRGRGDACAPRSSGCIEGRDGEIGARSRPDAYLDGARGRSHRSADHRGRVACPTPTRPMRSRSTSCWPTALGVAVGDELTFTTFRRRTSSRRPATAATSIRAGCPAVCAWSAWSAGRPISCPRGPRSTRSTATSRTC